MKGPREIKRWLTLRCEHCGHRFRWKRDARHSYGNRDGKVYHGPCMASVEWRTKATERLAVLHSVATLAGVDGRTIRGLAELQAPNEAERIAASDQVWRVFYDMGKLAETTESEG